MKKTIKLTSIILAASIMLCFCSCGIYNKEYLDVNKYVIQKSESKESSDKIVVTNLNELTAAVGQLVNDGKTNGEIVFSENYSGDVSEDLAEACWKERSQDALCAYCVDNISYELSKIVSYNEAKINIIYGKTGVDFKDIHKVAYVTSIPELIDKAIADLDDKLVILVDRSGYTAENIISLVTDRYYMNPICLPTEPQSSVQIYSGNGYQKLYSISFNYKYSDKTVLAGKIEEMKNAITFTESPTDEYAGLCTVANFLKENCTFGDGSSIYDVLIRGQGNSKAISLATVSLCASNSISCQLVTGQKNYVVHYWTIVDIDGNYYHFDPSNIINGSDSKLLKTDDEMWNEYRWDTSSYPKCYTVSEYK